MKFLNSFYLSILTLVLTGTLHASENKAEASKRIAKAVKVFAPLAQSGMTTYKGKPTTNIKAALLSMALKEKYISEESEFSWVGKSDEVWGADSMGWGEATMKDAYSYVTEVNSDYLESLKAEGKEKEMAQYLQNIKAAKDAFKLLLNSGVMFGVAPIGAVQCGVTFAALVIIDPHSGTSYVFAKEGSGC